MLIRAATDTDLPQIIELLKVSLGESLMPKSESLWRWKHFANPFGISPAILAEVDGKLIGIRAFLRWEFWREGGIQKACRAVDTAVHPDYQGQGIFKKLTLELISKMESEGIDLIFNTPNADSLPGYLKMGWEKWGKLPLKLHFHLSSGKNKHPLNPRNWSEIEHLITKIEAESASYGQTHLKVGYLSWRYQDSPICPYYFLTNEKNYLLFYRIKEGKMGREFRICDFFQLPDFSDLDQQELNNELKKVEKLSGARFTSFAGFQDKNHHTLKLGALPILKVGPIITLRQLNPKVQPMNLDWNWSLGDLEVF
jgi:GNAT superfamily N-acetyltransferase